MLERSQIPWGFQNPLGCLRAPLAVFATGRGVLQAGLLGSQETRSPHTTTPFPIWRRARLSPWPLSDRRRRSFLWWPSYTSGWQTSRSRAAAFRPLIGTRRRLNGYLGGGGALEGPDWPLERGLRQVLGIVRVLRDHRRKPIDPGGVSGAQDLSCSSRGLPGSERGWPIPLQRPARP